MQLTERERRQLAEADRLNAILSNSSIAEGAENAQLRERIQAQALRDAQSRQGDMSEAEALMAFKARQAELDRAERAKDRDAYGRLTAPEQRTVRGEEQTFTQLGEAADYGQGVVDQGGDFKGIPDLVIGALRDWEYQGTANFLTDLLYDTNEKEARSKFSSAIGNWRKNLSGAQVTGIERTLGADWDPTASGIGSAEAIARARRLQSFINNNREALQLPPLEGGSGGTEDPYEYRTLPDGTRQRRLKDRGNQ